jgi:hypothetical protein
MSRLVTEVRRVELEAINEQIVAGAVAHMRRELISTLDVPDGKKVSTLEWLRTPVTKLSGQGISTRWTWFPRGGQFVRLAISGPGTRAHCDECGLQGAQRYERPPRRPMARRACARRTGRLRWSGRRDEPDAPDRTARNRIFGI